MHMHSLSLTSHPHSQIKLPPYLSPKCHSLIKGLLDRRVEERLGGWGRSACVYECVYVCMCVFTCMYGWIDV